MCPTNCDGCRLIIVSNILPLRAKKGASDWEFEWDEDALVAQAKVQYTPLFAAAPYPTPCH